MRIQRIGIGPVAAQQDLQAVRRVSGLASAAGAERQRGELRGNHVATGEFAHQAARLDFFRCTSRMDTAAGVTPATRAACPTVAGRICASFCRTSFDSPATARVVEVIGQAGFLVAPLARDFFFLALDVAGVLGGDFELRADLRRRGVRRLRAAAGR